MQQNKTKNIVMAALLTALSILITFSPFKLVFPTFTLTPGAHVPTMIAMFINPWVTVMTIIGSCIGFFMAIPAPNNLIVVARALSHIIFAVIGLKMLDKKVNIFIIITVTAVLHSVCEAAVVYVMTPMVLTDKEIVLTTASSIAFVGTFVHHLIDSAITFPILYALNKAHMVNASLKKNDK